MSAADLGKLRWRCRRGMRELDVLLTHYLDAEYLEATPPQQAAFRQLLEAPDPLLYAYFLGRQQPDSETLASLVMRIAASLPHDR